MKRCSTSYVIRKMKIKTRWDINIYLLRRPKSRTPTALNDGEDVLGAPGALIYCWWKGTIVFPLWKRVWQFLTKHTLTMWSVIIPLGIRPKGMKTYVHTKICPRMFIADFIRNCPNMFLSRWKDKLWYIQTIECQTALKRNELW